MEIEHDTTLDKIFKDVLNIKGFVSTFLELNKTELKYYLDQYVVKLSKIKKKFFNV